MKIALIIERMEPDRGGRETSTAQIADALVSQGHAVTIICQQSSWQHAGVEVRPICTGNGRDFVEAVQRICESREFDITHSMLPIPGVDVYQPRGGTVPAQVESRMRTIPCPVCRGLSKIGRSLNSRRRYQAKMEKMIAADTHTFCLAVSEMVAREFSTHYGREKNVRVVFNGVDVPQSESGESREDARARIRRQLGINESEPVFLTIATNFELKGVDFAIRSLAELRTKTGRGTLIAVGNDSPCRFRKLAETSGVGQAVHFVDRQAEILPWYAAADGVVLLSWYDASSRVVLEACRLGIPSITTVFNGAAESLSTGGGIVVSSPAEIPAVAGAMAELAEPEKRQRRSEICLAESDKLSMDRHVHELLEIFKQIQQIKNDAEKR